MQENCARVKRQFPRGMVRENNNTARAPLETSAGQIYSGRTSRDKLMPKIKFIDESDETNKKGENRT